MKMIPENGGNLGILQTVNMVIVYRGLSYECPFLRYDIAIQLYSVCTFVLDSYN